MGKYGDFWSYVDKGETDEDCWLWNGAIHTNGYGVCRYEGKTHRAHRIVYTLIVGDIPEGLHLDHLCRVRACVNPAHLEPVTNAENGRRGLAGEVNRKRMLSLTHCKNGHEFDMIVNRREGSKPYKTERSCSICRKESARRYQEKKKLDKKNKL